MKIKALALAVTAGAAVLGAGVTTPASAVTPDPSGTYAQKVAWVATYIMDHPEQFPFGECTRERAWIDKKGNARDWNCTYHAALHGKTANHDNVHLGGFTMYRVSGKEIPAPQG